MSFDDMWLEQLTQQRAFYHTPTNLDDQERIAKDLLLHLHEEVAELHADTVTKAVAVKPSGTFRANNMIDSAVDVVKLVYSLLQLYGVPAEDFTRAFTSKTLYIAALRATHQATYSKRRLVLDLDGCVADIMPFVRRYKAFGENETWERAELEAGKAGWYESGGFLGLPVLPGAAEVVQWLKRAGWSIIVVTARPVWDHRRVGPDTVHWLHQNKIPFDGIYFGKDKADIIGDNVLAGATEIVAIEDRDKHALELAAAGVPVLMPEQRWNESFTPSSDRIQKVTGWAEIKTRLNAI